MVTMMVMLVMVMKYDGDAGDYEGDADDGNDSDDDGLTNQNLTLHLKLEYCTLRFDAPK